MMLVTSLSGRSSRAASSSLSERSSSKTISASPLNYGLTQVEGCGHAVSVLRLSWECNNRCLEVFSHNLNAETSRKPQLHCPHGHFSAGGESSWKVVDDNDAFLGFIKHSAELCAQFLKLLCPGIINDDFKAKKCALLPCRPLLISDVGRLQINLWLKGQQPLRNQSYSSQARRRNSRTGNCGVIGHAEQRRSYQRRGERSNIWWPGQKTWKRLSRVANQFGHPMLSLQHFVWSSSKRSVIIYSILLRLLNISCWLHQNELFCLVNYFFCIFWRVVGKRRKSLKH